MGRVYHRPGAQGYQVLYADRLTEAVPSVALDELCARREDMDDPMPPVVAFPTPAYDPDLDRFELTAKGRAALDASAHNPD